MNLCLDYEANVPQSVRDAAQTAASILDNLILDNITVHILVGYGDLNNGQFTVDPGDANGTPLSGMNENYADLRSRLASHETSSVGQTFVNSLPNTQSVDGISTFFVPSAIARALGFLPPIGTTEDGAIGIGKGVSEAQLVGVALHELTHALGRVNLDVISNQPNLSFDLARYISSSPGKRLFTDDNTAAAAYFSLDGSSVDKLADYGQASDPSDFLNSGVQGPNDPFDEHYGAGTFQYFTIADKYQMAVLGFNVDFSTPMVINTRSDLLAVLHNFNLAGHYVLGANIDATGITIPPIGSSSNPFTGTFDGNGHTINGLSVTDNGSYVGLFASIDTTGWVHDLGLTNLSVSAPHGVDVGGLVGHNLGQIDNSFTTGNVSGMADSFGQIAIGGLAGFNDGIIFGSHSSATINSLGFSGGDLGGLSGVNTGPIVNSYATGSVSGVSPFSGGAYIGGLVGRETQGVNFITNSHAGGAVSGTGTSPFVGGLVGRLDHSAVAGSYATGVVKSTGVSGGLVGEADSNGHIFVDFATGNVSADEFAGGLVGQLIDSEVSDAYATGAVSGRQAGGLAAAVLGDSLVDETYATGRVTGSSLTSGGLIGDSASTNLFAVTNSYWDPVSTGQSSSQGGGNPYNFLNQHLLPPGFDPNVWGLNSFQLNPIQTNVFPYLQGIRLSSVIEDYLSGAIVFSDDNNSGALDPGESVTATDLNGSFVPIGGTGPLVAYGGTDTSTGLPFKGTLEAPAGSTAITPLTTLIALRQTEGVSDPQVPVLSAFGISLLVDLTTFDPIAASIAGDVDGAAAEVAGAEVYDTASLIASGLAGAGGNFATGASDVFSAIASALNNGGNYLTDQSALSDLISSIAQTEGLSLGQNAADSIASVIAASNVALGQKALADGSGEQLVLDTAAVELVSQGAASNAIAQAASDPNRLRNVVTAFTGVNLDGLTAAALSQLGPTDDDTGEQTALKLTISPTLIGSATAMAVPFEIAGLDLEDSGTVTFTDLNGNTVTVNVNGAETNYSGDLSSLADGAIASSMAVNTDPAGNSFTPVAGTIVTLDQDTGEQAALKLVVNSGSTTPVNAAAAVNVAFAVAGLEPDDSGTITFSDGNPAQNVVVQIVAGIPKATSVNLSGMTDGPITSVLALNTDTAGNTFSPVNGNGLTLRQLDHWMNSLGGNWATASNWNLGVPTATIDADIDASGSYTVALTSNDIAYGLLLSAPGATVTDNNAGTLSLAGPGGAANPDGALNINAGNFVLNGGGLKAGSISIARGGVLLVSQSYTGASALPETITGNGAITILNKSNVAFTGAFSETGAITIENTAVLDIVGPVTGTAGSFTLMNNAKLEFGAADSEDIIFAAGAAGTLKLDRSALFTGTISGLTKNNAVDLADLSWVSGKMKATFVGNTSGGVLTVTNGATNINLKVLGDYTKASWNLSQDGSGGTLVVDPPVNGAAPWPDSPLQWLEQHVPSFLSDFRGFQQSDGLAQLIRQFEKRFSATDSGATLSGHSNSQISRFAEGWQSYIIQTMASFVDGKGGPLHESAIQLNEHNAQSYLAANVMHPA
jgi:hypothetical protein